MITVLEDMANKEGAHTIKNKWFQEHDVNVERVPLPVGDYVLMNEKSEDVISRKKKRETSLKKMDFLGTYKTSVDTKENMTEIVNNICGKSHARFRDECILAQNNGIKLYILVENMDRIKSIEDVFRWQNPRTHRYNKIKFMHNIGKWENISLPKMSPTNGQTLAKAMLTMQLKYGVEFRFCRPDESAGKILELLGVNANVGKEDVFTKDS